MLLEEIARGGLADPIGMEPWHPIETAPKDGSFVHLKFNDAESIGFWMDGEWRNGLGRGFGTVRPKSWMRLL